MRFLIIYWITILSCSGNDNTPHQNEKLQPYFIEVAAELADRGMHVPVQHINIYMKPISRTGFIGFWRPSDRSITIDSYTYYTYNRADSKELYILIAHELAHSVGVPHISCGSVYHPMRDSWQAMPNHITLEDIYDMIAEEYFRQQIK